jgi:hypothetical protein
LFFSGPNCGHGERHICEPKSSRYRTTFGSAGSRRAFSLHAQSALSGKPADGGWNRRPGQPFRIYFSCTGKLVFFYRLILREEESLPKTQGESYRAYCRAVPRFWPALKPRVSSGNLGSRLGPGLRGRESFVWLFGLAELLIAATLNPWFGIVTFLLAFVAHFLVTRRSKSSEAHNDRHKSVMSARRLTMLLARRILGEQCLILPRTKYAIGAIR